MPLLREIRTKARQITPPVIGACLVAYFAYHAVQGERGLLAWWRLQQDLGEAKAEEARLADERARLELRVGLLNPDHLDTDMLDERAHAVLNYGRDDEYVILLPGRTDPAD